jgi:uncharacterized protein YqjF (DUF2071 family)
LEASGATRALIDARPRPLAAFCTALRQRDGLEEIDHRPWPLPDRPWFMGQTWRHLLFAHWPVDADVLARVIPPELPLDLHEGRAWIGVTPFRVEGFRLRGTLPPPFVSRFLELNVRTYVEYGGKPGIYFLSLDAASRLAVAGARRTYRLPYFLARMSLERDDGGFRMRSTRVSADGPPAELSCRYSAVGKSSSGRPGSLEHWLTERYCLYTLAEGGTVQRAEIHHPPWPLQAATAEIELNTMASGYRLALPGEPLLHYSDRQDVVIWTIEPVLP